MRNYPLLIAFPSLANKDAGRDLMAKYGRPDEMASSFHRIYEKYFTAEEVLQLISFYKTPVGQKLVVNDEPIRVEMRQEAMRIAIDIALDMVKEDRKDEPPPLPPEAPIF